MREKVTMGGVRAGKTAAFEEMRKRLAGEGKPVLVITAQTMRQWLLDDRPYGFYSYPDETKL